MRVAEALAAVVVLAVLAPECLAEEAVRTSGSRVECRVTGTDPGETDRLEVRCLAASNGLIARQSDKLTIRIEAAPGRIVLSDNRRACRQDDADKCHILSIDSFDAARKFVVLTDAGYESLTYRFVSLATGAQTEIFAEPEFSPSGNQFVVVNANEMDGREHDLTVFSITDAGLKRTFAYAANPDQPYESWEFQSWKSEDAVALQVSATDRQTNAQKTSPVDLMRGGNGTWTLINWPRK